MASIQKVENKKGVSYKINVHLGNDIKGKKITKSTTFTPDVQKSVKQNEKDLQKFALEFEEKVKNGNNFDGVKLSFEEFAHKWLEHIENNVTHGTYESYRMMLTNRIIPYFRAYKISAIKLPMIESFYLTLVDDYAPASIKKIDIILNGMFKTAIRWQMIEKNPCTDAVIPKTGKPEEKLKYYTPQQALAFLASLNMTYETAYKGHKRIDDTGKAYFVGDYVEKRDVPTQLKVFFNIALFCGMRKSEILALHWSDINFEEKTISITKSVTKEKDGVAYKEPKTKTSIRTVSMPEQIIPLLKQYRSEYNAMKISFGDAWKGDGNIFIQSDGTLMGRSTSYQAFKKHIKRYNAWVGKQNKELSIGQKLEALPEIPLHGLRHSCATLLNYLGVNIIDISKVLGHAQTSTTMNIYAHSFEECRRVASDKIDEFIRLHA